MRVNVPITGDSIKLGQFLKLANLAESGGHAKELIEAGEVTVDGEVVTSRGFLLHDASVVRVGGFEVGVEKQEALDGDDDWDDDWDPEKWRNM